MKERSLSNPGGMDGSSVQQDKTEKRTSFRRFVGILVLLGAAGVLGYGLDVGIRFCILSLFVGGTALVGGFLLGFLFGIPRTLQEEPRANAENKESTHSVEAPKYRFNTNLEQISDWLTKILIGVTLTQFGTFKELLGQVAGQIARASGEQQMTLAYPAAIILYFLINGFLFGYLWTRMDFTRLLVQADTEALGEVEKMLHEQEKQVQKALQVNEDNVQGQIKKQEEKIEEVSVGTKAALDLGIGRPSPQGSFRESSISEQAKVILGAPQPSESLDSRIKRLNLPEITTKADWNKNRFRGRSDSDGRRLKAKVSRYGTAESERTPWFQIRLTVESTNEARPLTGTVIFFLHDTFTKPQVEVPVANGMATLTILAVGPFTVGAVADEGETRLELDLFELQNAPKDFVNSQA